jgi:hypothetical protein
MATTEAQIIRSTTSRTTHTKEAATSHPLTTTLRLTTTTQPPPTTTLNRKVMAPSTTTTQILQQRRLTRRHTQTQTLIQSTITFRLTAIRTIPHQFTRRHTLILLRTRTVLTNFPLFKCGEPFKRFVHYRAYQRGRTNTLDRPKELSSLNNYLLPWCHITDCQCTDCAYGTPSASTYASTYGHNP